MQEKAHMKKRQRQESFRHSKHSDVFENMLKSICLSYAGIEKGGYDDGTFRFSF